jgi:hypothetical protein
MTSNIYYGMDHRSIIFKDERFEPYMRLGETRIVPVFSTKYGFLFEGFRVERNSSADFASSSVNALEIDYSSSNGDGGIVVIVGERRRFSESALFLVRGWAEMPEEEDEDPQREEYLQVWSLYVDEHRELIQTELGTPELVSRTAGETTWRVGEITFTTPAKLKILEVYLDEREVE